MNSFLMNIEIKLWYFKTTRAVKMLEKLKSKCKVVLCLCLSVTDPSPLISFLPLASHLSRLCGPISCSPSPAWPVCFVFSRLLFLLPASLFTCHKDGRLVPLLITLNFDRASMPAGQQREGDPVHLDLTFCCLVAAFCFSFSPQSIYGLFLTHLTMRQYWFPSFETMINNKWVKQNRNYSDK